MFDALFFIFVGFVGGWFTADTLFAKNTKAFLIRQYNNYKDSNDDKTKTTL